MALLPWKRAAATISPQTRTFEDLALPLLPSLYNLAAWLARNPADAEEFHIAEFRTGNLDAVAISDVDTSRLASLAEQIAEAQSPIPDQPG